MITQDNTPIIRKCQERRRKKGMQSINMRNEVRYQGIKPHCKYWQVTHTTPLNRAFRVVVKQQDVAAAIHDRLAILRDGLKAKTNFSYNRKQLYYMLQDIIADRATNLEHTSF